MILVDKGIPGWEASGRNGGWAAGYGSGEGSSRLLKEGIRIWQTLDEELDAPTEFVLGGSLSIASTEEEVWFLDKEVEHSRKAGVDVRKVDLREMQEILPGLNDRALVGSFHPASGQANPQLTCQAWAWAIERLGGRIYQNAEVTGIEVQGGRVTGVETAAGGIRAEQVVNAAGPWCNVINGMVGQALPTQPHLIEMLCTLPVPPLTEATFFGNNLYCRQAVHGHLHFGGYQSLDIDVRRTSEKPTSSLITGDIARRFVELVPTMSNARVLRTWAGIIDASPDGEPIIGRVGYPDGYYVNVGFGGLGFSWSPIAGVVMSDLLVDGESPLDIGFLRPGRFAPRREG